MKIDLQPRGGKLGLCRHLEIIIPVCAISTF